ncbi:MAG: hypothetical protein ACRDUA_08445, partial [Micromonosporaceae bacterium]
PLVATTSSSRTPATPPDRNRVTFTGLTADTDAGGAVAFPDLLVMPGLGDRVTPLPRLVLSSLGLALGLPAPAASCP